MERSGLLPPRHARVRLGKAGKCILTVLRLATKKPWAIDVSYFTDAYDANTPLV